MYESGQNTKDNTKEKKREREKKKKRKDLSQTGKPEEDGNF